MNFSAYAVTLELSDLAKKKMLTSLSQPQLPMSLNFPFFASSSADQVHIDSQNNSGCKGLHIFNGIFTWSKLQWELISY